ncbi:MAG: hypothetical protein MJ184_07545 [Treponema sp.]|uniref:hypothetical protein n=1 Tax=Treponema sp. TaxID=166 RepID=UPI00298DC7E6|nr:hypothetical protein [Treponema sp.]MCQ2601201.1 hypothetical protein [Treponema sp.]
MNRLKLLLINISIILLVSCELSPFIREKETINPEQTNVKEETSLFNQENSDDQSYEFVTNDTRFLNRNGYTFWSVPYVNTHDDFEPVTVTVRKESGRSEAGFGIVFCKQELNGKSYMLTVLINGNGLYTVGKVIEGSFYYLDKGWKPSDSINRGQGVNNKISVSYDSEKKLFNLYINDYKVTSFSTSEDIIFKNSKSGFAVVIANNETFPANPVKVTFEK